MNQKIKAKIDEQRRYIELCDRYAREPWSKDSGFPYDEHRALEKKYLGRDNITPLLDALELAVDAHEKINEWAVSYCMDDMALMNRLKTISKLALSKIETGLGGN